MKVVLYRMTLTFSPAMKHTNTINGWFVLLTQLVGLIIKKKSANSSCFNEQMAQCVLKSTNALTGQSLASIGAAVSRYPSNEVGICRK